MTTDLNELKELREIVMGEFNTDYGGGNVGLTPAGEKLVELIDAALSTADSAIQGSTDATQTLQSFLSSSYDPDWIGNTVSHDYLVDSIKIALSAYRRPTADEVAEIERAITELTDVMLGGISWKSQCLAITALHKMKGD